MIGLRKVATVSLFIGMVVFQVPEADARPPIRQAVIGHLSMSEAKCLNIAKKLCDSAGKSCRRPDDDVQYLISTEDYNIGIACAPLRIGVTIMVLFGAVDAGKDRQEEEFNDLFVKLYNNAVLYFR